MFGYIYIAIWRGVLAGGGKLSTAVSFGQMATYITVSQALLWLGTFFPRGGYIDIDVRTGAVISRLLHPVDYYWRIFWSMLGQAGYNTLFKAVPIFVVLGIIFKITFPPTPIHALLFVCGSIMTVLTGTAMTVIIGMLSFRLTDIRNVQRLYYSLCTVFSGFFVPPLLFGGTFKMLCDWLPFIGLNYVPVAAYLAMAPLPVLLFYFVRQLVWITVLILLGRAIFLSSVRSLNIQGG